MRIDVRLFEVLLRMVVSHYVGESLVLQTHSSLSIIYDVDLEPK
tara:strand:+ start:410 stop:541 length:132 start_codon:yes stop_codon:yes gene_type:complete